MVTCHQPLSEGEGEGEGWPAVRQVRLSCEILIRFYPLLPNAAKAKVLCVCEEAHEMSNVIEMSNVNNGMSFSI